MQDRLIPSAGDTHRGCRPQTGFASKSPPFCTPDAQDVHTRLPPGT